MKNSGSFHILFFSSLFVILISNFTCKAMNKTYNPYQQNIDPTKIEIVKMPPSAAEDLMQGVVSAGRAVAPSLLELIQAQIAPMTKEAKSGEGTTADKIAAIQSALYRGTLMAAVPLTGHILTRLSNAAIEAIQHKLMTTQPTILNQNQRPIYGKIDRLKRWWAGGYKPQKMVFDPEVKKRLIEIEKKTNSLRNLIKSGKTRTYANLLLYGEPGTGKTLFAQVLANKTDMDFLPVTAASLLQAGVEGIKYFDELITMAYRSSYGTIIFIDEADALFVDRTTLDPGSEHYKILNHILSIIDGRSNKFMIVAATNHAYLLDEAMGRRFQDRVFMPLPNLATRIELLSLYASQLLFNEKETSTGFVTAAKKLLTSTMMSQIAEQTDGLSHSEIADMVETMRNKAELNSRSLILADIQSAMTEAIKKKEAQKADREKLKQRMEQKKTPQSPA